MQYVSLCLNLPNICTKILPSSTCVWRCLFFRSKSRNIFQNKYGPYHVSLCLDLPNFVSKLRQKFGMSGGVFSFCSKSWEYMSKSLLIAHMFVSSWICQISASKPDVYNAMSGAVSSFWSKSLNICQNHRKTRTCLFLPESANSSIKTESFVPHVWRSLSLSPLLKNAQNRKG